MLSSLLRAMPRVVGMAAGVAVVLASSDWWMVLGFVIFVISVPPNIRRWWAYVTTGEDTAATSTKNPVYREPGSASVTLQSPGDRPVSVIKAIRDVSGAGLADAKSTIDECPSVIVSGISSASAVQVRDRIAAAGGTASIREG